MQKMGFARRWVNWIMACVTSVRYTVKFNGTLLESFAPSCGLRQGDPLSPFLFLFVADGLSALLENGDEKGDYSPLKICRRAPGVSHLLFTDDTMLLFKAQEEQAKKIMMCYTHTRELLGNASTQQSAAHCLDLHAWWKNKRRYEPSYVLVQ